MVASRNSDPYTPFPQGILLEESSSDGSGLHSPIFGIGAPFPPPYGDSNLRYHHQDSLDLSQRAAAISSQFDYHHPAPTLKSLNLQQHPLLDTTLEPPVSSLHHHRIPSGFPLPSRNHLGLAFPGQLSSHSRFSPPPHEYVFHQTPERRLPSSQSHDQPSYNSPPTPGMPMDNDHQPSSSTTDRSTTFPTIPPSSPHEQRKDISSLVIACHQCRARKIRCDSTRPMCNNCVRRSNECHYDTVPKRRGPDKRPGTRQRSCKKRPPDGPAALPPPKRKRPALLEEPVIARIKPAMERRDRSPSRLADRGDERSAIASPSSELTKQRVSSTTPPPSRHAYLYDSNSFVRSLNGQFDAGKTRSEQDDREDKYYSDPPSHVLEYNQKVWDNLLGTYSSTREQSLKDIVADLSFLFSNTSYWLSFASPLFLQSLYTDDRLRIQPSFVLAGLALATLMKSSDRELGESGRKRALWFRDAAQRHLESSWNSQWIDVTLAEAALVLALFELSVHPQHAPSRVTSSLLLLDNIICTQSLTYIDAQHPDVSSFGPTVPTVHPSSPSSASAPIPNPQNSPAPDSSTYSRRCQCVRPENTLPADHLSIYWSYPLPWNPSWSTAEVRREECRRLCWSALNIVSSYTAQCAAMGDTPPDLFLCNPANFALLFPGEALERPAAEGGKGVAPGKETIWALYCRSMLLWNFCDRLRHKRCGEEDEAEFALEAWAETQAVLDALDKHDCGLNASLVYLAREFVYNTRMTITRSLRRFVPSENLQGLNSGTAESRPIFNRKQAEEWLYYQDQVITRIKASVHQPNEQGQLVLTRRPFQVPWFSNQLAMCISVWENDRAMVAALDLGKSILGLVDVLCALWPCPTQQTRCDELREKLVDACTAMNLRVPHPADESSLPRKGR